MKDYIVRASAANAQIRAFAAVNNRTDRGRPRKRHETSPVATAALGRLAHRRSNDGKHDEK